MIIVPFGFIAPVRGGSGGPLIANVNYSQVDTAGGGAPLIITGSGFTGATAVANASSFIVNSDSQITATMAAHAAGLIGLTVTTPLGVSNAKSVEYWDPSVASPTGRFRGYPGAPWPNTGSVGGSASGATPPTVGPPLNGRNTADFVHPQALTASGFADAYTPNNGFAVYALVKPRSLQAATTPYDDPAIWSDSYLNIGITTSGLNVASYSSGWKKGSTPVPCTTGEWHFIEASHDGTTMSFGVDGTTSSFAVGANQRPTGTYPPCIGQSVPSTMTTLDAVHAEIVTFGAPPDATLALKMRRYFQQRYAVTV